MSTGLPVQSLMMMKRPWNVAELERQVNEFHAKCTCRKCAPKFYDTCPMAHSTITPIFDDATNIALGIPGLINFGYEATQAAYWATKYVTKGVDELNLTQKNAIEWLNKNLDKDGDALRSLANPPLDDESQSAELTSTLLLGNDLFFFSAPTAVSSWGTCKILENSHYGATQFILKNPNDPKSKDYSHITVNPHLTRPDAKTDLQRAYHIMGKLLHGAAHSYLFQFTCRDCPTGYVNLGHRRAAHWRAWQILIRSMEENVQRIFNVELDLGRFTSFRSDWHNLLSHPSPCDIQEWKLEDKGQDSTPISIENFDGSIDDDEAKPTRAEESIYCGNSGDQVYSSSFHPDWKAYEEIRKRYLPTVS